MEYQEENRCKNRAHIARICESSKERGSAAVRELKLEDEDAGSGDEDLSGDLQFCCLSECRRDVLNVQVYQNCSCLPDIPIVPGPCPLQCSEKFNIFIAILCIMSYFSATGRAGNTIIQFRSVSEDDKAVSIGLTEAFLSVFAFIPAPIFYGALLDYGCLVWGTLCGKQGNCWLYDGKSVRYYMNFTASFFIFLATLADFGVWKYSYGLKLYEEEEEKQPQELQPLESKPPPQKIEMEN